MDNKFDELRMQAQKLAAEIDERAARAYQEQQKASLLQGEAACNEIRRPRPWTEVPIEEKIERTRGAVKSLERQISSLYERLGQLSTLRSDLVEHRHDLQDGGKVMLPANRRDDRDCCCLPKMAEEDPSQVYF